MIRVALENTASISTNSNPSLGNSGMMTLSTKKCFCLAKGFTGINLLSSSFLGFRAR